MLVEHMAKMWKGPGAYGLDPQGRMWVRMKKSEKRAERDKEADSKRQVC